MTYVAVKKKEDWQRGSSTYNTKMFVNGCDSLVCAWFQQLGWDDLLDCQNNAIFAPNADGCATILDCLDGVFDLEVSTVGGEDGVGEIVTRSYRGLWGYSTSLALMAGKRLAVSSRMLTYHGDDCVWVDW